MGCKVTINNTIKTIAELGKLGTQESKALASQLISTLNNTRLEDHFEDNKNSKGKIDSFEVVDGTIVSKLTKMTKEFATKIKVSDHLDKSLPQLGSKIEQGWQSVVTYLLRPRKDNASKNEWIDENVEKAIALVTAEWLATDATMQLAGSRDDASTKALLGLHSNEPLTPEQRESVADIDGLVNRTANQLGGKIYKLLGLKAKPNSEMVNNERIELTMKTELGLVALKMLEANGILKLEKAIVKDYKQSGLLIKEKRNKPLTKEENKRLNREWSIIKFNSDGKNILIDGKNVAKEASTLVTELEMIQNNKSIRGIYLTSAQAVPKDIEIINEGPTGVLGDVVSQTHKDAVKKQSATPNTFNKGYVKALAAMDTALENGSTILRTILGYTEPTKVLRMRKTAVEGKNKMIDKAIEDLTDTIAEVGFKQKMYARWKVITNNRFMIDSNRLNWQDKKLHRYAVDRGTVRVTKDRNSEMNVLFRLALAQSMDISIDKMHASTALEKIDKLLEEVQKIVEFNDESRLEYYYETKEYAENVQKVYQLVSNGKPQSEPEHMIRGVVEAISYLREADVGYDTGLMIETDAITSGYAIKGMQFPLHSENNNITEVLEELEKVGIFTKDDGYGYGDRAEAKVPDAYEEPATVLSKKLKEANISEELLEIIDDKSKIVDGVVKISRNFMKNPFMVLNYGSAVDSIINGTIKTAEENLYKLIEEFVFAKSKNKTKLRKKLNNVLVLLYGKNTSAYKKAVQQLAKDPKGFILDTEMKDVLRDRLLDQLGEPLKATLEAKYGHFISLSKVMNNSFASQFRIAKIAIDKKLADRYADKLARYGDKKLVPPVSKAEMEEVLGEVKELLPVFGLALDKAKGEKAEGLIAESSRKIGSEIEGNVATTGKVKIKGVEGEVDNAALEVYELVESVTGGAVLPIHFFDGSIQAKVLAKYNALGVHDANYGKLDEVAEITKYYNEEFYKLNKSYSIAAELMDGLLKSIEGADFDIKKEMSKNDYKTLVSALQSMSGVYEVSMDMRDKLFGVDMRVQHAFFEGKDNEVAEFNSKYDTTELAPRIANYKSRLAKAIAKVPIEETSKLKATSDYLPEVNISTEEVRKIDKTTDNYITKLGIKVKFGDEFNYNPEDNSITLIPEADPADRAVYTAHEVKHAITYKWLKDGKNRKAYKYLVKAMEQMKDLDYSQELADNILKQRLDYATSRQDEFSRVAELVAILNSEPTVRKAFMKKFPQREVTKLGEILDTIKELLGRVGLIDTSMVIGAVDSIVERALEEQIINSEYYQDKNNKNTKIDREELRIDGKLVAYASIGKATISGMIGGKEYKGYELERGKKYRTLNMIQSNKQGQGYADGVLGHVINKYGNEDMLLEVYPMEEYTSKERLISWYESYGFEVVKGTGEQTIMVRKAEDDSANTELDGAIMTTNKVAGVIATLEDKC